jgi:hypothetical protein
MVPSRFTTVVACMALTAGCVKTRQYKVARYEAGAEPLAQLIPRDGWYKVKWKVRDEYKGVDHTARYLTAGTPVGFETSDDGTVVARVHNERTPVGEPRRKAKYCCWHHESKEPTQFAIELREALGAAGEVVQVLAIGGAVTGIAAMELFDGDDDCEPDYLRTRPRPRH